MKAIFMAIMGLLLNTAFADQNWKFESSEKDLQKQFLENYPVIICNSSKIINKYILEITKGNTFSINGISTDGDRVCLVVLKK